MKTKALEYIDNYMTEQEGWDIDDMIPYRKSVFSMYEKEVDRIIEMNSKGNQFMNFFNIFGYTKHNFEYNNSKELAELAIKRVNKYFKGTE